MKKILLLSHEPHEVHLNFAKSIGAEIKVTPFKNYIALTKRCKIFSHIYPFVSLIYSLFVKFKGDILLVDGGTSLYTAVFIKLRNPRIKIIYLDGDILFYNIFNQRLNKEKNRIKIFIIMKFIKKIDASISVSEQSKEYLSGFLKIPGEICVPYPKQVKKLNVKRENYGLYVGRLVPEKEIKKVINFAIQCPYFEKFVVVGDGVLRDYVIKIAKKNKKIIYLGKKEDLSIFYSQCKFLIHLPDSDPHPCTTMEAAICGCFPVISRGAGTKYLFDNIFIVDNASDFMKINNKIKYILDNEKKSKSLLKKSLARIPTKEESINNFKNKFNILANEI
jgi:glycosyltransferase involved in cell wall biosynthesis